MDISKLKEALINTIGKYCNFSQEEIAGWDKLFIELDLKYY